MTEKIKIPDVNPSTNTNLAAQKKILRKKIRSELRELTPEQIQQKSLSVLENFWKSNDESVQKARQKYENACHILFYMPLPTEVNIVPLIEKAMKEGKNCYLPRIEDNEANNDDSTTASLQNMTFYKLDNSLPLSPSMPNAKDSQLEVGKYDILEPKTSLEKFDSVKPDTIVIVPGLAFGRDRTRLGKGKGYYDKFFAQNMIFGAAEIAQNMTKLAFCFDCQLLDTVPHDKYDIKVDIIITEFH